MSDRLADRSVDRREIHRLDAGNDVAMPRDDDITVEGPLEIRLQDEAIAVLMRTPGDDLALAAGFLLTEGVLPSPKDLGTLGYCATAEPPNEQNVVEARLTCEVDVDRLRRNFYATSSCGVCGKASIDQLRTKADPISRSFTLSRPVLWSLSDVLRKGQAQFERTGALHASALFDLSGDLLHLCEDVGRHNAMDKLVGHYVLKGERPPELSVLLVSGRVSFEIVQKAVRAGIPIIASIGSPSSLAVEMAMAFNMTLLGFVSSERFNVYSSPERLLK